MPIKVTGPDGVVNNFPDDTTDDVIKQAMRKQYGGPGEPAQGEQGSLYDPKNPVLSDDPRYWPPVEPASKTQRANFLPLEVDEKGKGSLAVPGIIAGPYQEAQTLLNQAKGGASPREMAPAAAEFAPNVMLPAARGYASREAIKGAVADQQAFVGPRKGPTGLEQYTDAKGRLNENIEAPPKGETPQDKAKRLVREAAEKDLGPDAAADARKQVAQGKEANQDVRLMDTGGQETKSLARWASNVSPSARELIKGTAESRFGEQNVRLIDWLRKKTGNPNESFVELEKVKQDMRSPTNAAYKKAYDEGRKGVIMPPMIVRQFVEGEDLKDVFAQASLKYNRLRNAGEAHGPALADMTPAQIREYSKLKTDAARGKYVAENVPFSLEFWDLVKREIDKKVSDAKNDASDARIWNIVRRQVIDVLDQQYPSYETARGKAGKVFGASDALEAGENIAKGQHTRAEIEAARKLLPKDEWGRVQIGYLSIKLKELLFTGDRRDVVTRFNESPGERQMFESVLGPETAKAFEAVLSVEKTLNEIRTAMGNSTTVQQAADAQRFGVEPKPGIVASGVQAASWGPIAFLTNRFLQASSERGAVRASEVNRSVAEHVATLLLSNDPAMYAEGIKELTKHPKMIEALRDPKQATGATRATGVLGAQAIQNRKQRPGVEFGEPQLMGTAPGL